MAAYVMFAYGLMPLGALAHPDMRATFLSHATAIYLHVFASIAALVLGPFQFSSSSRQRRPNLHRWASSLYLSVGMLAGVLSGLYISQYAFGGLVSQLGFAVLAGLWLLPGCAPSSRGVHGAPQVDGAKLLADAGHGVAADLLAAFEVLGIADLDQEDGLFHGPEIDVYHDFDRVDLRQRAAQAGFTDIQFQTVFSIAKEHVTGTLDYPVFLMTARRASA